MTGRMISNLRRSLCVSSSGRRPGAWFVFVSLVLGIFYMTIYFSIDDAFALLKARQMSSRRRTRKPYYHRWDPITHRIDIPMEDRHDINKPTSLELLQDILQDFSSNPTTLSTSSCFRPNIKKTRKIAERIDSSSSRTLGLPLLNVGFPKSGSSTLRTFLRQTMGWNASHYSLQLHHTSDNSEEDDEDNGTDYNNNKNIKTTTTASTAQRRSITVGEQMIKAANEGLSPFTLLSTNANNHKTFQAHTQLDYTGEHHNFFPQIQLLDEIHMAEPNSTFVLLFRPVEDWIRSTQGWHFYPLRWANSDEDLPDLGSILTPQQRMARDVRGETIVLTEDQLRSWWCIHVQHIRRFVETYPSHTLIELDLYDTNGTTTAVLPKLFGLSDKSEKTRTVNDIRNQDDKVKTSTHHSHKDQSDIDSSLWPIANRNPVVKEKRPGPISMHTHYYQLWNHTTNQLKYINETSKDRFFGDDRPTSFEILQRVIDKEKHSDGIQHDESSCYRPRQPKPLVTNSSFPALHVGLPLVGNEFLKLFFRSCVDVQATSKKVSGGGLVGKKMMEAVHAGLGPISGYFGKGRAAFVQLDYTAVLPNTASSKFEEVTNDDADGKSLPLSSFPQIQLLDELHEDVPKATFILPFRSGKHDHTASINKYDDNLAIQGWIDLSQNFHNFTERWASMEDLPGLYLTEDQKEARKGNKFRAPEEPMIGLSDQQLRSWWCTHVQHIREFVRHYPSHDLIEFDLLDHEHTSEVLLAAFPQADPTCLSKLLDETNLL